MTAQPADIKLRAKSVPCRKPSLKGIDLYFFKPCKHLPTPSYLRPPAGKQQHKVGCSCLPSDPEREGAGGAPSQQVPGPRLFPRGKKQTQVPPATPFLLERCPSRSLWPPRAGGLERAHSYQLFPQSRSLGTQTSPSLAPFPPVPPPARSFRTPHKVCFLHDPSLLLKSAPSQRPGCGHPAGGGPDLEELTGPRAHNLVS